VIDILAKIVDSTRRSLTGSEIDRVEAGRNAEWAAESRDHRFARAIMDPGRTVRLIAEIKSASPSAGTIVDAPDVESIAWAYREGGAAAVSIVTEPEFFRGSRTWIRRASDSSGLPVLMKEFVVDPLQIDLGVAAGADAVLLIAAILEADDLRALVARVHELGCDAVVEIHDEHDLEKAVDARAEIVGVNNRDLRDFSIDLGTSERLSRQVPAGVSKIAESGIRTRADIERLLDAGFDGFLVGESILRQSDLTGAVRSLVA